MNEHGTGWIGRIDAPEGKRQILAAALGLFARQGLDGTSIREIGEAARLTNPALYRHFDGKEALAEELFFLCYRALLDRLEGAVAGASGFEARLSAFVDAFLNMLEREPETVVFVNENLFRLWPRVQERLHARTIVTLVRDLAKEGPAGRREAGGIAVETGVVALLGALAQLSRMRFLGGAPGPAGRWRLELERLALLLFG